jgi:hypothetical protein
VFILVCILGTAGLFIQPLLLFDMWPTHTHSDCTVTECFKSYIYSHVVYHPVMRTKEAETNQYCEWKGTRLWRKASCCQLFHVTSLYVYTFLIAIVWCSSDLLVAKDQTLKPWQRVPLYCCLPIPLCLLCVNDFIIVSLDYDWHKETHYRQQKDRGWRNIYWTKGSQTCT